MRITDLPVATGVNGGDTVPIVQGGVAKQATADQFASGKQTASAILTGLAAISGSGFLKYEGSNTFSLAVFTSYGLTLATAASVAAQRAALGLGTAATKNVPASGNAASGETVLGSDSRLSDSRAPTSHTHTLSSITDAGTAAAKNVPASGDASSTQVVLGNDSRLSGSRAPTAHKTTHATGGSDALAPADIGAAASSHTHLAADVTNLGTAALKNAPASGNAGAGEVVLGSDSRLSDARTPTTHTHLLASITDAGTAASKSVPASGDASSGQVVLGSDSRLTNTRAPSAHKTTHATGGSDALTAADVGAAAASHSHVLASITDAGTAAALNAPATGNATTSQVVVGNDTRLSDARTPATHHATHSTGGSDAISPSDIGAAAVTHKTSHATGGADALSPADIGAATSSHTHTPASIGAATATHTHTLSSITDAGTIASQNASAVHITGGTMSGVTITGSSISGLVLPGHVTLIGAAYAAADTMTSANSEIAFTTTVTIPAGTLSAGDSIHISARGVFTTSATSSQTIQFRLKLAGADLLVFTAIAMTSSLTNKGWSAEADLIVVTDGGGGTLDVQGAAHLVTASNNSATISVGSATALVSIDTTSASAIGVSTQWGATTGASSVNLRQLIVTHLQV